MKSHAILEAWKPRHSELFGRQTIRLSHRLAESGLFTDEILAELIDRAGPDHATICTMGTDHRRRNWRNGDKGSKSGREVIDAVRNGRIWINLQRVDKFDPRYADLLDRLFAEFEARVPGLSTYRRSLGILISSPKAQVYYHADIPGQMLWQVRGGKRIYIYPNSEPFLKPADIENVVMGLTEEDLPYEAWFDEYADVYELEPGQMLHWALNGPHRVVNHDCLNVSVTTEHWTNGIRASYAMNYANGVLRRIGVRNPSRATAGPAFYAKVALAGAVKYSGVLNKRRYRRVAEFLVDPDAPGGFVDIQPSAG